MPQSYRELSGRQDQQKVVLDRCGEKRAGGTAGCGAAGPGPRCALCLGVEQAAGTTGAEGLMAARKRHPKGNQRRGNWKMSCSAMHGGAG